MEDVIGRGSVVGGRPYILVSRECGRGRKQGLLVSGPGISGYLCLRFKLWRCGVIISRRGGFNGSAFARTHPDNVDVCCRRNPGIPVTALL